MSAVPDPLFARLVSLACHDLRTPLATVHGFARTLTRSGQLGDPAARYVSMIEAASGQIAGILDDLTIAARIVDDRYDPVPREATTGQLAASAAASFPDGSVTARGEGVAVSGDLEALTRALAALAHAARRHGGVATVELRADAGNVTVAPVTADAAPVVVGDELRDLGSAVAVRVVEAHGGSVALAGETLCVRLPPSEGGPS